MTCKKSIFLATLVLIFGVVKAGNTILATEYSSQSGTWIGGEVVKGFSTNDYLVYASINFGQSSTTKGFLINWAKGNEGGKLEIRLGVGTSGQLVGEISPARTKNWDTYETAYVDIIGDVSGVHDVTLVAKDNGGGVMNLAWFELTDFAEREEVHRRILGAEIANQSGATVNSDYGVGYFDDGDFVTYTHVNFGSAGTTDGIRIRTAKGNDGGTVEVRLGGPTGTLLAQFNPVRTGAWSLWSDLYVGVTDVTGIHDVTFVGKGVSGVMNMQWFELSSRKELYPHVPAMAFSTQSGLRSDSVHLTYFDSGDYVTYSKLNFGSSGATKSIRLSYAKANNSGSMEVRLGGPTGTIIGTFVPTNTGGWGTYVEAEVSLDLVDGIHDLTFVGRDSGGVLNLGWFELSEMTFFEVVADYKVDNENGRDTQCNYSSVLGAYTEQVFNKYYMSSSTSVEQQFFADLGVSTSADAQIAVYNLCGDAQAAADQM